MIYEDIYTTTIIVYIYITISCHILHILHHNTLRSIHIS